MTYSLEHVEINEDDVPCVVREDDGSYLTLSDTNIMIELKNSDPEGFALLMILAKKMTKYEFMGALSA